MPTTRDYYEVLGIARDASVEDIKRSFKRFNLCFTGHNHRAFLGTPDAFIFPHEVISRFNVKGRKLYNWMDDEGVLGMGLKASFPVAIPVDAKVTHFRRKDKTVVVAAVRETGDPSPGPGRPRNRRQAA